MKQYKTINLYQLYGVNISNKKQSILRYFGSPSEPPANVLPTFENTMKYCNLLKTQMKEKTNGKQ